MAERNVTTLRRIQQLAWDVFSASFLSLVLLSVVEELAEGFVSYVLNINIVVWIVVVSGALSLLLDQDSTTVVHAKKQNPARAWAPAVMAAAFGTIVVWLQTAGLGLLSLPVALLAGAVIAGAIYVLLHEETTQ